VFDAVAVRGERRGGLEGSNVHVQVRKKKECLWEGDFRAIIESEEGPENGKRGPAGPEGLRVKEGTMSARGWNVWREAVEGLTMFGVQRV